mmetsp:Transcript_85820/g.152004  ORF Transcript_85820/g.152004 Transcript_85820/m.152004 type:complete len:125 (-) Transcript_85820:37-411(-)
MSASSNGPRFDYVNGKIYAAKADWLQIAVKDMKYNKNRFQYAVLPGTFFNFGGFFAMLLLWHYSVLVLVLAIMDFVLLMVILIGINSNAILNRNIRQSWERYKEDFGDDDRPTSMSSSEVTTSV